MMSVSAGKLEQEKTMETFKVVLAVDGAAEATVVGRGLRKSDALETKQTVLDCLEEAGLTGVAVIEAE
jgi:hypothetical protein